MQKSRIFFPVRFIFLCLFFLSARIDLFSQDKSNLPLVVIDTWGEEIPDNPKIVSWIKVIDHGNGLLNSPDEPGTDFEGYAGIEIRGRSSQMFPKKSYSIELRNASAADSSVSLLGMPAESDWVLYAPYSDKTMLRNAITFHLGRSLGSWQPRYRFCEVYLNEEYNGVYMLLESIKRDSNRVRISKLKPDEISGDDLTGGYIVKVDKLDDLSEDEYFSTSPSITYKDAPTYTFTYVYPKHDEIASEQKNYIRNFLTDAENNLNGTSFADPQKGFRKYFDVKSFVDFQIIQEITNNVDGYRLSTYFYKDKDSKGGTIHAGPLWDFDLCYGNEDYTDFNLRTDTWLYPKFADQYGGRIHWWARMMEDMNYRSVFISRWKELREKSFASDSVMSFIDNTVESLGEAINRNFEKWPVIGIYIWPNYFVGSTYEEEISYLKNWLTARLDWIDKNIVFASGSSGDVLKQEILVFPNPVRDHMNVYFYSTGSSEIRFEMFDILGHKVFENKLAPSYSGFQYVTFDFLPLRPGYYILKVIQGNRQLGKRNILIGSGH
ncbi:MAG: CotH kinase family protein [Bacteroidota bacterium]|nr:CotH kinase family protein [Bacteroidota bacterium]